jgi:hypothetical protein
MMLLFQISTGGKCCLNLKAGMVFLTRVNITNLNCDFDAAFAMIQKLK